MKAITIGNKTVVFDENGEICYSEGGALSPAEEREVQNQFYAMVRDEQVGDAFKRLADPDAEEVLDELRMRDDAELLNEVAEYFNPAFDSTKEELIRLRGPSDDERAAHGAWKKQRKEIEKIIREKSEKGLNSFEDQVNLLDHIKAEPPKYPTDEEIYEIEEREEMRQEKAEAYAERQAEQAAKAKKIYEEETAYLERARNKGGLFSEIEAAAAILDQRRKGGGK